MRAMVALPIKPLLIVLVPTYKGIGIVSLSLAHTRGPTCAQFAVTTHRIRIILDVTLGPVLGI